MQQGGMYGTFSCGVWLIDPSLVNIRKGPRTKGLVLVYRITRNRLARAKGQCRGVYGVVKGSLVTAQIARNK